MPKVRRYHCYKLTGMTRANDGTWCVYADADKRYRELEAQVEKYKSEIRESCEDMRSEYRTCDLAHELGEKNKELEAQLAEIAELPVQMCIHISDVNNVTTPDKYICYYELQAILEKDNEQI